MKLHKIKYLALCTSPSGWLVNMYLSLKSRQADGALVNLSHVLALQPGAVPAVFINRSLITVATTELWSWVLIDSWITEDCSEKKNLLPFGNINLMVLASKLQADYFRKTRHFLFGCSSESTQAIFLCRKGYICWSSDWRLGPVHAHLWRN